MQSLLWGPKSWLSEVSTVLTAPKIRKLSSGVSRGIGFSLSGSFHALFWSFHALLFSLVSRLIGSLVRPGRVGLCFSGEILMYDLPPPFWEFWSCLGSSWSEGER